MPVWLRRTLIAAGLGVALLAAAAAWFVASFDANRYKGLLIDRVQAQYGRTLAIDGPIGLSLFPRLQLTLRDVKLSEPRRADEFMALQEASLSVQMLPLLRQQLAVDRVGARGVRLVYSRDAQGRRNIDDLLAKPADTPAAAAPSAPGGGTLRFDVRGIELAQLQLAVRDALAGIEGRFEVEHLATGRLADGAESPVSLQARAKLTKPAIDAQLALDGLLKLELPAGAPARVGLRDLTLALRGAGFGVQGLDAKLSGALRLDGSALAAERLTLTLSGERLGLALKDSRLALASLAHDPARRTLKLEGLELQLAGRRGGEALAATLAWPRLEVAGDTLKGGALQGSASLKSSAQTLQLAFASQAPSGSFERIRVPGLKVQVSGSAGPRSVKGEARSDLTLATAPFSAALDALALQLAFADPALPPTALALKGSAKGGAAAASWSVEGSVNEQAFSSSGKADLSRPVPKVEAQARFAALDLTRFVAKAEAPAEQKDSAPAADAPLDLSGLKAIDGSFTLRAGSLVYPPYRVADAALDATLAGGTLRVSQLAGRAWGGRFSAQATAQAATKPQEQRASVKFDASDVDVAGLLKDVAQFQKLEGRGQVKADLQTQGASVGQFRRQLGGSAAIQLRDGAVRGINLAKALRQWRSAVTLNKDAVQSSSAQEKTDFSEISASFQVADGVARNQDLSAKSPFLRVTGAGAIDIGQGRIDYLAKATVTATPEGQDGAELAGLKGLTVPVKLAGPFEAVSYNIQWGAVAGDLLKKRATEAIGGKTGGLLDRLTGRAPAASAPAGVASAPVKKDSTKDRLKQLFGR